MTKQTMAATAVEENKIKNKNLFYFPDATKFAFESIAEEKTKPKKMVWLFKRTIKEIKHGY